ncbi:MAG: WecB/TagA/CpsF family glycosyltransferase [Bacillota bacterium]
MQTKILDVPFDVVTMEEATIRACKFLKEDKSHYICTPNPEIVMLAQKDTTLMQILQEADLVIPDGIGVVLASKVHGEHRLPERVAGYDLTQGIFMALQNTEESFYFFGGGDTVSKEAKEKMQAKYPHLKIVGVANGFFDEQREKEIIQEINDSEASVLLVGLGAPKQEKWIYDHLQVLNVRLAIGVGGSFDVMAERVKRAPVQFQKLGLEWLYRFLCQPTRWKRMLQLPLFVFTVLRSPQNNEK